MIDAKPQPKPPTFYTAFMIWMRDEQTKKVIQLHCTHKYLGNQTREAIGEVVRILKTYFLEPKDFPPAVFVGPLKLRNGEMKALGTPINSSCFFGDLREQLDPFREDDYPEYHPHITIESHPTVVGLFQCYALLAKINGQETVLAYWRNPAWEKLEAREKRKNKLTDSMPQTESASTKPLDKSGAGQPQSE